MLVWNTDIIKHIYNNFQISLCFISENHIQDYSTVLHKKINYTNLLWITC
jgi:hypothetical protein